MRVHLCEQRFGLSAPALTSAQLAKPAGRHSDEAGHQARLGLAFHPSDLFFRLRPPSRPEEDADGMVAAIRGVGHQPQRTMMVVDTRQPLRRAIKSPTASQVVRT